MRLLGLLLSLIAFLDLCGCSDTPPSKPRPATWTTGFWFWGGSVTGVPPEVGTLDVLFLHVGTINKPTRFGIDKLWSVRGQLPDALPPAREYWLVFRFERQEVPDLRAAPILAEEFFKLREDARQRGLKVTGIQLDIDSPTRALSQYASFLREVRKGLPIDAEVSITALLDWFREGTAIADVIKEAEEFVPQFYDADLNSFNQGVIATRFDSARWASIFNRFNRRFRIGISSFGRAQLLPKASPPQSGYRRLQIFNDLTPLDVATNSGFTLESRRSETNELVLNYSATQQVKISYHHLQPGDTIQFIVSTPDSVRAAVEGARRIQGYCAGVVFFRWPTSNETLAMQPAETLLAAGLSTPASGKRVGLHLADGGCVAVKCTDVYLINASLFSPKPVRYLIRSSTGLEYFIPEENIPVTMSGPSELTLLLPPYCGRPYMYLGRAVSARHADFTVEDRK